MTNGSPPFRADPPPNLLFSPESSSSIVLTAQGLRERRRALLAALRALEDDIAAFGEQLRAEWHAADPELEPMTERYQAQYGFTPRELEVAELLAEGLGNKALAGRLGISVHTARHHTQRVLTKLGVHSRAEAIVRLRH